MVKLQGHRSHSCDTTATEDFNRLLTMQEVRATHAIRLAATPTLFLEVTAHDSGTTTPDSGFADATPPADTGSRARSVSTDVSPSN